MNKPSISLVIPAYNEADYIGTCLDAVTQNAPNAFFEIIVIDNASTDATKEISERYPNVRVVREERKGLTYARQCGFASAKGDVIAYIDADTRMPKGWYEVVEKEFTLNPNLASLSGPYIYYDFSSWQQFLVKIYWWIIAMPAYTLLGYMTIGGNFAIRRSVLEKMGGFDTSIEFYGEDTDIARRAHKFGKVKFKPSFVMYTSARRLKNQGLFRTAILYIFNFIFEAIFHRPMTKEYKDIR